MIRGNAQSRCQPQERDGMHRIDRCRNKDGQSVGSNENAAVLDCLRLNRLMLGIWAVTKKFRLTVHASMANPDVSFAESFSIHTCDMKHAYVHTFPLQSLFLFIRVT